MVEWIESGPINATRRDATRHDTNDDTPLLTIGSNIIPDPADLVEKYNETAHDHTIDGHNNLLLQEKIS